MRKTAFVNEELYHIYNRGVDKRNIVSDEDDSNRFIESMIEFNAVEPIGSLYERSFVKNKQPSQLSRRTTKLSKFTQQQPLVEFIAYCLNPNHFHFILKQVVDGGISEFMKRLAGYSRYFNEKYNRNGALFQGKFKSIHIHSDEYLLHLGAYVNLNDRIHTHKIDGDTVVLVRSSWNEYMGISVEQFCNKDIILGRYKNTKEYEKIALETIEGIINRRFNIDEFLLE